MLKKIAEYIETRCLLSAEGKHLVALSGGADSVALLRILLELGYNVEAAHCNFHLRGDESVRDEKFCQTLCSELGVSLHLAHFDTYSYASLHKVSIEMAARDLRYAYFKQLADDIGAESICVAHHKNDQAETVLLNLVRGTGVEGLKGMLPRNGRIVRPLLCVRREDIITYLQTLDQGYITDSTNLIADVKRNKIRLNIIPLLENLNPSVIDNISMTASRVYDVSAILEAGVSTSITRVVQEVGEDTVRVSVSALLAEPSPEYLLWNILKERAFTSQQVEMIFRCLESQTGREWASSTHVAIIDRGALVVAPKSLLSTGEMPVMRIPETGRYVYDADTIFRLSYIEAAECFKASRIPTLVTLDADKVAFPLTIRPWREGDVIIPYGMRGRKLVSDLLTDAKMPVITRRSQKVVEDSRGEILWVVGLRVSDRVKISSTTKRVLEVELIRNLSLI